MKIVFISPAGAMHRYSGNFHRNLHYAPLTMTFLASLIPKEYHAEVSIYDETVETIPLDLTADILCITCITGTAPRSYRYADYFRAKGITVFLGGTHPSLLPEEAREHADTIFVGMADDTFPQAIHDFMNGTLQPRYDQPKDSSIHQRTHPRRDLLNPKQYITVNTVEAIRGCNLNCTFCAYPAAFGRQVHPRLVDDIIEEIKTLRGKFVVFSDVNLMANMDFITELSQKLKPLRKWWFGLATVQLVDYPDLVQSFRKSGCKGLLIGFESVIQESNIGMQKGVNVVGKYEKLMKLLHKNGIQVMGCFAFGDDHEDASVFQKTVDLVTKLKIDLPRYALLTPFPNTKLYEKLDQQGRITENDWSLYDVQHCVYEPKQMTKQELENGIVYAWKETYKLSNIIRRISWFNFRISNIMSLMLNYGYRKYADKYKIFTREVTIDNSDIPVGDV